MTEHAIKNGYEKMSPLQTELHTTDGADEEITSWYYRDFTKTLWQSTKLVSAGSTPDGDLIKYGVEDSYSYLIYSYLKTRTPQISVKADYKDTMRICLCPNYGHNMIIEAKFVNDNDKINTLSPSYLDDYAEFYVKAGKEKSYNRNIGNVPELLNWSTMLPSRKINFYQPWYYSEDSTMAFPIYYKNKNTKSYHTYKFRKSIAELVRIQIKKDDKWENFKLTKDEKIEKYLDFEFTTFTGENTPRLWCRYGCVAPNEIEGYACKTEGRTYYYKDIITLTDKNVKLDGEVAVMEIKQTAPILAIFWKALNMTAFDGKSYSNYTTNAENENLGLDPIIENTLEITDSGPEFENMESDHFNDNEARMHFPNSPTKNGYHVYAFTLDTTYLNANNSKIIKDGKLSCKISAESSDKFTLQVNLMVYRKLELTVDDKGLPIIKVT